MGLQAEWRPTAKVIPGMDNLRRPELITLDETTTLESESELLLQEAIDRLADLMAILVIVYLLSSIKPTDMSLVIDKSAINATGINNDMIKEFNAMYRQLWNALALA
jgi:ATP-binding cassette subfamily B protein